MEKQKAIYLGNKLVLHILDILIIWKSNFNAYVIEKPKLYLTTWINFIVSFIDEFKIGIDKGFTNGINDVSTSESRYRREIENECKIIYSSK